MTPSPEPPDVINQLAGIAPDSQLAHLRTQRPDITRYAQGSYETLFEPDDPAGVSRYERELIALRIATLTATPALAPWHEQRLRGLGASDEVIAAVERFPNSAALSARETALLKHADHVASAPASSTKEQLDALTVVGLGPRDIVTISQLIAFLSFQVRTLAGLRILAEDI